MRWTAVVLLALVAAPSAARADDDATTPARKFYFRAGAVLVAPLTDSDELVMTDVDDVAGLAIEEGPVAGSAASIDATVVPAAIIGYVLPWLDGRLSVEFVLGPPVETDISARGSLATESLAPDAMGIPTGVPALGTELGKTKFLPPVLTAVYRTPIHRRVGWYAGGGLSLLIPLESKITNPVLTEVSAPVLEVDPDVGVVLQAGLDAQIWRRYFLTFDVKYILGFSPRAHVRNMHVKVPDLPLYETVRVGDAAIDLPVNPLVVLIGAGTNF